MLSLNQKISGSVLFSWQVDIRGYEISNTRLLPDNKRDKPPEPPFIIQTSVESKEYVPFKVQGLNRHFAGIDSRESLLRFVNKYGLLGPSSILQGKDGEGHLGESIHEWLWEIAAMNSIMGIWDLIYLSTPQKIRKLKEIVIWNLDGSGKPCNIEIRFGKIWSNKQLLFYRNGSLDAPTWNVRIFRRYIKPDEGWEIGDVVEPALMFLAYYINNQIEHKIDTRLQSNRINKELPFLQIYLEPTTLIDALWIMCLLEITDNVRLSRCRFCGMWFQSNHALRVYCSDKCKQADYRKRIKITPLH